MKKIKLSKDADVNFVVVPPSALREIQPEFRGSTVPEAMKKVKLPSDPTVFISKYGVDREVEVLRPENYSYVVNNSRIIENRSLTVGRDLVLGKRSKFIVFRNCTIEREDDSKSVLQICIEEGTVVIFEDCTFISIPQFLVKQESRLNLVRCCSGVIEVDGVGGPSLVIDDCTIQKVTVDEVQAILIAQHHELFSCQISNATFVTFARISMTRASNIYLGAIKPLLKVYRDAHVTFKNCTCPRTSIIAGQSVFGLTVSQSNINDIGLCESCITYMNVDSSKIDHVKADRTICGRCTGTNGVEFVAATRSKGFPDTPVTLFKKARLVVEPRFCWWLPYTKLPVPKEVVVMLEVPGHALKHLSSVTHKVRVSEAKVADIMYTDLSPLKFSRLDRILHKISVRSCHDRNFVYKVGETVKPTLQFDGDGYKPMPTRPLDPPQDGPISDGDAINIPTPL